MARSRSPVGFAAVGGGNQLFDLLPIQKFRNGAPLLRAGKVFGGIGRNFSFGQQKTEKAADSAQMPRDRSAA